MNSDGDKVYKEIVAEHNMKRQKKDKIYKTSKTVQFIFMIMLHLFRNRSVKLIFYLCSFLLYR